jgi:hypothetical protein
MNQSQLRSPREKLGGYLLLPRLIDKVRLSAEGTLPQEYRENVLKPGFALSLDARLLTFTGLEAEALRQAILSSDSDEAVLAWVEQHAKPHSEEEKQAWADAVAGYRPDAAIAAHRRKVYPELAAKIDVTAISVLDLIDMDEERMPVPE